MSELIELGLEGYSHLAQRCEMKNVTQFPTTTGNANVQLATFPSVRHSIDRYHLDEGETIADAQKAFGWVFWKAVKDGKAKVRAMETSSGRTIGFKEYEMDSERIIPFQVLEFTDLNAFRWCVLLIKDDDGMKCWRFRADSEWHGLDDINIDPWHIGDLELEDRTAPSLLWEVFVNGFFYDHWSRLRKWDYSGYFKFGDEKHRDFSSLSEWMELARKPLAEGGFEIKTTLVMSEMFLQCLEAVAIREIETSRWTFLLAKGETPIGGSWMEGLGMARILMQTISDGQERGTEKVVTNADIIKAASDEWGISNNEAFGILTLAASGAYLGGSIGTAAGPFGTAVGGIVGGIVGGLIGVGVSIFSNHTSSRFYFTSIERNDVDDGNDELSGTEQLTSDTLKGIVSNIFHNIGRGENLVTKFMDGQNKRYFNTAWTDIPIGSEIPGEGDDPESPYNSFIILQNNLENLARYIEYYNVTTRMRTWYSGFGSFRIRTIGNFMRGWVLGDGKIEWIRAIDNASPTNVNHAFEKRSVSLSIRDIASSMRRTITSNASINTTIEFNDYLDAMASNINDFLGNPSIGLRKWEKELDELLKKMSEEESGNYKEEIVLAHRLMTNLSFIITHFERLLALTDSDLLYKNKAEGKKHAHLSVSSINQLFDRIDSALSIIEGLWNTIKRLGGELGNLLILHKNDVSIWDIETLSHMLIVIADGDGGGNPDMFYHSDAGTFNIQSSNFYSAEYSNGDPVEAWRLGNRLAMFTSNTIEMWDVTNDFEDPMSPAYSSNVYSYVVLQNSRARFDDALYFIAKPAELDSWGVYSLSKNGQVSKLSYPTLDKWISDSLMTGFAQYNPISVNWNTDVNASVIGCENVPIIQFMLGEGKVLNYNAMFRTFFLSDHLHFMENGEYFQYGSRKIGTLDSYINEDGTRTKAMVKTVNTNFGEQPRNRRWKTINAFHGDVELENGKNPASPNSPDWMTSGNPDDCQAIFHRFWSVSKSSYPNSREVRLRPLQGERNIAYRLAGLGLGIDFQAEIWWNGYLRINKIIYEAE